MTTAETKEQPMNELAELRKRVDHELTVSRDRLSRAEIISRSGNWEFDFESKRVYGSDGARKIYGLPGVEWTIPEVQRIPLPEYRDMLDRALKALVEENRPYDVEFKIRRPDTGEILDIHSVAEFDRQRNVVFGIIQDITERKQTEEALRESEERYRTVIEGSNDGIVIMKGQEHLYVNRRFLEIFGYADPSEVVGKTASITVHRDDLDMVSEINRKRQRSEPVPSRYEFKGIKKDGTIIYIEVSATKTTYQGESVSLAFLRDVTERKQAEETLRINRTNLSEAMDLARMVHWEVDLETDQFVFNDAFYSLCGTTAEREGGYRMSREEYVKRFMHLDDLPAFREHLEKRRRSTEREFHNAFEHRMIRRDGELRHILALVHEIRDTAGRTVRLYGANQDITNRKRAEEAIRESETALRSLIDATRETLLLTDIEGTILVANETVARRLGKSVKELVGTSQYQYFPPEIAAHRKEEYDKVVHTGKPVNFQDEMADRVLDIYAYPVFDDEGRVAKVAIFASNISERKSLEAQLLQAQKMEAIGTLAGGVAHDFNNILMALMGYGNLLQMKMGQNDPLRVYVDQILSSTGKAANITQSLLAFGRKQVMEMKPYTITTIVKDVEKLLQRLMPEDIEFTVKLGDDTTVMADMTQIDQVLMNLATNARDAMPKGGRLTIETGRVVIDSDFTRLYGYGKPDFYALVSVSDTGTGMDEKTQKKIFEPFYTTKEVGKGTGLGLSIVYGIIKQHNGYINVSSRPGEGTTFLLYLPEVKETPSETRIPVHKAKGGSETLLFAEDNPDIRAITSDILIRSGYTVIEAVNGQDAVERFREHQDEIQLIILDVVMPEKNGKEAYEEIQTMRHDIKALFMSGYTGDVVMDRGVSKKAFDYIPKPISPNELLIKVREVLDR
jgi:PAS domain S-box-containing protein